MKQILKHLLRHDDLRSFTHNVFLSYTSADKAVVQELAERLRGDGIRVCLEQWEIKRGESSKSKIESALDSSRVLVLVMSKNVFESDWATLESQAIRFRDAL